MKLKYQNLLGLILAVMLVFNPNFSLSQGLMPQFSDFAADVDPHSGSATMSIPIEVPQGRGGIQPGINLQYNSKVPNGMFGVGWVLELGSIQRLTVRGVPQYDSTDGFCLLQAGTTQGLVFDSTAGHYRTKIEGAFSKVEFVNDEYWLVTDKKGTKYFFGEDLQSREHDPNDTTRVFKWTINKVEDVHGNTMLFTYLRDGNKLYPQEIAYTSNPSQGIAAHAKVIFAHEDRDDDNFTYISNFRTDTAKRIHEISVEANNQLQRKYVLGYSQSNSTKKSLLTSVTMKGSDDTTAYPTTTFKYHDEKGFELAQGWSIPDDMQLAFYHYNSQYNQDGYYDMIVRALDLNADNYPDFVRSLESNGSFTYPEYNPLVTSEIRRTFLNTKLNGWNMITSCVVPLEEQSCQEMTGSTDFLHPGEPINYIDIGISFGNVNSYGIQDRGHRFADINGDGYIDVLNNYLGSSSSSQATYVHNQVDGWTLQNWTYPPNRAFNTELSVGGLHISDVDADGYPDMIISRSPYREVYINQWPASASWQLDTSWHVPSGIDAEIQYGATLIDINGDSLQDLYKATAQPGKLHFNNGKGWEFVDHADWARSDAVYPGYPSNASRTGDINGDGLIDIIVKSVAGNGTGPNPSVFYINTGNGFFEDSEWVIPQPEGSFEWHAQFIDANADGLMDYLFFADYWGTIQQNPTPRLYLNTGKPADLLYEINNGVGGITTIEYASSAHYDNTFLPFITQVVKSTTVTNSRGDTYTTQYDYKDGLWNTDQRQFRGFGEVKITDAEGHYTISKFAQGEFDKGRLIEQESYDVNGNLYAKTENIWNVSETIAPGVQFIYLQRKDNFVYDGDGTARRTAEEYFYEESPQYGNVTKAIQYGEVDLNTGTDTGTDKRSVETTYVSPNTTKWIIGFPSTTVIKNDGGTIVRQTWFDYDDLANGVAPTYGLLSQKKDLFDGTNDPVTTYDYDVFGNLIKTIAPNQVSASSSAGTTITYDPSHKIFPLTTTNAMNHTVTNTYYGINGVAQDNGLWGQLKSTEDPNQEVGTRKYDVLGRIVASISPLDSDQYPTKTTEYVYGVDHLRIKTQRRLTHNTPQTIDAVTFVDGLGRKIQSKAVSGKAGFFVIADQTQYNSRGLPQYKYLPYFVNTTLETLEAIDTSKPRTEMIYDAVGRIVETKNPDNTYATVVYDDWTSSTINENGHMQKSHFDAYGRLISKEEYTGSDGRFDTNVYPSTSGPVDSHYTLYATTHYKYDSEGNLIETKDAHNNITTMTYDNLGRKSGMVDPDMGTWVYTYDANGNLKTQLDNKGQNITFTYDDLNRLVNKHDDNFEIDVNYTYDDNSTPAPNSKGRLTEASYGGGKTEFMYDELGREKESIKQIDNPTYDVQRQYDALNNLLEVQYPNAQKIHYKYNDAGQIEQISNDPSVFQGSSLINAEEEFLCEAADALCHDTLANNQVSSRVLRLASNVASWLEQNILGVSEAHAQSAPVIPQSGYTVVYVDSEELTSPYGARPISNALDGNVNTFWHTQWYAANPVHPHEVQIDLGDDYDVEGFTYLPRQDTSFNGTTEDYEFYVSSDGTNWGSAVASGAFANDKTEKEVTFNPITARYVRFVALSEVNNNAWTAAAEIQILGQLNSGGPTNQAPTFNITSNQTADEGDLIQFTVSATDPENDPLNYAASNLPTGASFNTSTQTFTWQTSAGDAGSYDVDFTVTDTGSLSDQMTVNISVNVPGGSGGQTGTISREVWENIVGVFVTNLTSNPAYPNDPTFSDTLTLFEAPIDWAENYGTRIRGYVHPPSSGDYIFHISGDDYCELYLSTDDTEGNKVLIANVPGWTYSREWDKYPQQESSAITLVGGQKYYIEALHKEGGGGDRVAVGWESASAGITFDVIPGANLSPYGSSGGGSNQAPTLNPIGNKTVDENVQLQFTISATDPESDPLNYSASNLPTGASFNTSTQTFTWTPTYDQAGTYNNVTFTVSDGQVDQEAITITVNNVNRAPQFNTTSNQNVDEGVLLEFTVSATDPDTGDVLAYSASNLPTGASFNTSTQTFSWTPGSGDVGSHDVDFTVTDSSSANDQMTVNIVVNPAGGGSGGTGTITREVWQAIGSSVLVSSLTGNANYPNDPTFSDELTLFEAPSNWDDSYGTRIRGYVHPTTSGDYTFYIAGDDNSELYLSTDDTEGNKVLIAHVPGWTPSRNWTKYGQQTSSPITLVGGQKYYIEALHKEGGGGDNIAVAWETSSLALEVIPGANLSPIGSGGSNPPPVLTFNADQTTITEGESATLTWSATNATDCTASNGWSGSKGTSGNEVVSPTTNTTYSLNCTGAGGNDSEDVVITVNPPSSGGNLLSYWKFDETSGATQAADSAGSNPGTIVSASSGSTGQVNNAYTFDGVDDYVDFGTGPAMTGTGAYSISLWIKTNDSGDQYIISQRDTTGFHGEYVLQIANSGKLRWFNYGNGAWGFDVVSNAVVTDGQWHHIVALKEVGGTGKLYIDGQYDNQHIAPDQTLNSLKVFVGADGRDSALHFNGEIDEIRLYDYALPQSEIDVLANESGSGGSVNIDADVHWRLDESAGANVALDSVGNIDGTITGATAGEPGQYGTAYDFDGTDDYIDMGDTDVLDGATALTVSAWIYWDSKTTNDTQSILRKENQANLMQGNYGGNAWRIALWAPSLTIHSVPLTNIPTGRWVHITHVWDKDANGGTPQLYIDGVYAADFSGSSTQALTSSSTTPFRIGATENATEEFDGRVDDVRIFKRALSPAEIQAVHDDDPSPAASSTLIVKNVEYNPAGQIEKVEFGNDVVTNYTYDIRFRLKTIVTTHPVEGVIQDLTYTYDGTGNVLSITDNSPNGSSSQTFKYDHLNRLKEATGEYETVGQQVVKNYEYDEIGNITEKDGKTYLYEEVGNAGPHAVTSIIDGTFTDTFVYDENGNMITWVKDEANVSVSYEYDVENRLVEVQEDSTPIEQYEYDGDGGRTKRTTYEGSTTTVTTFIGEFYEEDNARQTQFVFLGDKRIAAITEGKIKYYHENHLGSANALTDENGVLTELTEYFPFGKISRRERYGNQNEDIAWYYFTGKVLDERTGLYFYGARYYNPELGKFITPDAIVQDPENPQTLNRYAYAGNNPVNNIDPSGHSFWKKIRSFFGKILGVIAAAITFVITGNPTAAFTAFNITDTIVSSGIALASGAPPGRVFGAIGMSILLNSIIPGAPETLSRAAQVGINAVRGAAISVATTAAIWGTDGLGSAAAWGAGIAGLGTFLATMSAGTAEATPEEGDTAPKQEQPNSTPDETIQEANNDKGNTVEFVDDAEQVRLEAERNIEIIVEVINYIIEHQEKYDSGKVNYQLAAFGALEVVGSLYALRSLARGKTAYSRMSPNNPAITGVVGYVKGSLVTLTYGIKHIHDAFNGRKGSVSEILKEEGHIIMDALK